MFLVWKGPSQLVPNRSNYENVRLILSNLTKTTEQRHIRFSGVFIGNFKTIQQYFSDELEQATVFYRNTQEPCFFSVKFFSNIVCKIIISNTKITALT